MPYWSIDLLYGFSLLLPTSRHELKQHALRLLSAQVIAVSCFLLWPLRFTGDKELMGEMVNGRTVQALGKVIVVVVVGLNFYLLASMLF